MEVKRCDRGHFYDAEANSSCPQCAAEQGMGGNFGATQPVFGQGMAEDYGATVPVNGGAMGGMDMGMTEPVEPGHGFESTGFGNADFGNDMGVEDYEDATQPVNIGGVAGFSPVAGWLVCIEGEARGNDYRIRAGYNYIGRSEHMDICIQGDQKIGREKHAMVAYDHEEQVFFFGPADGKSIVRVNGKMVMTPTELNAYDIITIGSTKLCFVPFCGERFNWND